jgi:hypothetical protein
MNPKCPYCNRVLKSGWINISLGVVMILGIIPYNRSGLSRGWICDHCKKGWYKGKSIITKKTSVKLK